MDRAKKLLPADEPIAALRCDEILRCIQNKPQLLDNKKWHELVVGWLLCQFFSDKEKPMMQVGFPLVSDWETYCPANQLTVNSIMESRTSLIEDRDVDVMVGFERQWLRCQVTRYVVPSRARKTPSILDLIAKKCRKSPQDASTILVVSVESQPHISKEELMAFAKKTKVPFGQIFLISKASDKRGHFTFFQLYPKVIFGKQVQVPLLV